MPAPSNPQTYERCECSGLTFAEIRREAKRMNTTSIKRLRRELGMGAYCSACADYVQKAIATGQTVFTDDESAAA